MSAMASDWTHARSFKLWSPASHTSFNSPRSHDSQGSTNPILGRFTTSSGRRPSRPRPTTVWERWDWASGEADAAATDGGRGRHADFQRVGHAELVGVTQQGVPHVRAHFCQAHLAEERRPNAFFPGANSATNHGTPDWSRARPRPTCAANRRARTFDVTAGTCAPRRSSVLRRSRPACGRSFQGAPRRASFREGDARPWATSQAN